MRSAQHLAVLATLLFGATLLGGGCYRPNIKPNGYRCGDGGACPDGFVCDRPTNFCVQTLPDGGATGGTMGTGGKGGTGGTTGTGGNRDAGVDMPCVGPVASCQPTDAGLCDPVCNTGCGQCFEKCSVSSAGALTCNAPTPGASVGLFSPCQQVGNGANQTDNCEPGQFCLSAGECGSRCYQFCRSDNDCQNGASCSRDAGGGHKFCDAPPADCDPVKGAASVQQYSRCAGPPTTLSCYLGSSSLTKTLCDCEFSGGRFGDSCTRSRDCFPGLVCYDPTGGTGSGPRCYPVCRLPGDGGTDQTKVDAGEQPCNGGPSFCLPFSPPNALYGYCNNG